MAVNVRTFQASRALVGGATPAPVEDDAMCAAIWAVAENYTDGLTSTRLFDVTPAGNVKVGLINIQGGQKPLISIYYTASGRWDGLQRRG